MEISTPRSSLRITIEAAQAHAHFACPESDWREQARVAVEAVRAARHPALPHTESVRVSDDGIDVVYALEPDAAHIAEDLGVTDVVNGIADIADAVAQFATTDIRVGPLSERLVVRSSRRTQLVAAGLWAVAHEYDRGTRGQFMLPRHFVMCPEDLRTGSPSVARETFFLGQLLFVLLAGRDPFPADSEFEYMIAVRDGTPLPLDGVPEPLAQLVARTLDRDPAKRPALDSLGRELRASVQSKPRWKFW